MHAARLKQKNVQVKEVKFRPGTDDGDYQIKLRNLIRFLSVGDKAKVTLRFRGREIAHPTTWLGFVKKSGSRSYQIMLVVSSFQKWKEGKW